MEQTDPDEFSGDDGLTKLLSILQASPLQQLPVPDSFSRLERWHQLRRRDHETIAELLVREEDLWVQLQSALYNPRSSRSWAKTSGGPTGVSASADGAASPMVGAGCWASSSETRTPAAGAVACCCVETTSAWLGKVGYEI